MSSLDLLSATGAAPSQPSSSAYADGTGARRPLTPIIFAGPGSNLYPLCDPYTSSSLDALPKALLPVANRPLISLTLQQLVSAGVRHALVLAPSNQHRAIEAALKTVRLQVPPVPGAGSSKQSSTSTSSAPLSSNIAVLDGLSASHNAALVKARASDSVAICAELLPLGPYDGKTAPVVSSADKDGDAAPEFRRISRPGTAELLRWVASIGKLEADPLILPVDLLSPSLPLSTFLLSYYSSCYPTPSSVASLLYERGAGESVGREREKEGPARLLSAWSAGAPAAGESSTSPLAGHELLSLSEPPVGSSSLDIRVALLSKHPRARMSTSLLDSHIYILRKSQVLPLLNVRKDFTSIREHVVPFIAKAGWQQGLKAKAGWRTEDDESRVTGASTTDTVDLLEGAASDLYDGDEGAAASARRSQALMRLAFERSSLASSLNVSTKDIRAVTYIVRLSHGQQSAVPSNRANTGSAPSKQHQQNAQRHGVTAPEVDEEERFVARANTLPTYLECNRFLLRMLYAAGQSQRPLSFALPAVLGNGTAAHNEISSSAQLSPDTLLAGDAWIKVGDRSSVKRCIVSPRVTIGRNVRLAGCVLMDGSTIGDGAKLENCILGPKSKVMERITLKDSDVGFGSIVKRDGKGEKVSREEDQDSEDGMDGMQE